MDYENRKSGRKKKKTRFCSLVVYLFSYFVSRLSKEGALKNTESGSLILQLIYYFLAEGHLGQGDDILIRISLAVHISLVGTGTGHLFLPSQAWSQGFQEPFHEYLEKKAVGCLCGLYFSKLDFAQSLHAAKAVLILPMLYEGCSYTVTNGQC